MSVVGNFSFYPVGQGCFYGGAIHYKGSKFVIVYDCGTVSSARFLNNSIIDFKNRHKRIDLLMISHFDKDHVSGIKDLLLGTPCDKVVIPYYEPLVRLLLLAEYAYDDDYAAFLRNPINYISEIPNVGEVIVMHGGNEDDTALSPNIKPDEPISDFGGTFNLQILGGNKDNESLQNILLTNEGISKTSKVKSYSIPVTFVLSEIWEFVFYLRKFNPVDIQKFRVAIDDLLSKTIDKKLQSLFDASSISVIQELYRTHIVSDINYTSLCVYHGPVQRCRSIYLNRYNIVRYSGFMRNNESGTILTGDSFIKNTADFDAFYKYYSPIYINECFFFQVPHHGSEKNWNMLPNGLRVIPFYIINHGFKRKKHPSFSVVDNINSKSIYRNILFNHQYMQIDYSIKALP